MATTTYVPTPQTDEQPPTKGGNGSTILKAAVFIALAAIIGVLVYLLIQENKDESTPKPPPTISSEAQVRDQAYKASEPLAREFEGAVQGRTVPSAGLTTNMQTRLEKSFAAEKASGMTYKGKDVLVSVTPLEYRNNAAGEPETLMKTCSTVGTQVLDKSGKNVRVMPDGSPATPGTKIGGTVTVTKVQGTWLVSDSTVDGPC